jgi:protein associated with RNAse G/E
MVGLRRTILTHMTTDERVSVLYRKFDGELHWNLEMHRLGQDEHGVWLGLPAESHMRKGDGPPVPIPHAHVILVPEGLWYTAVFNDAPAEIDVYCDMTTPPSWTHADEVTMIDLDLDVLRTRGQKNPRLVDEDEFAAHQVRYGYPPDFIAAARASAKDVLTAIAERSGPFAGAHERWLAMARSCP